MNMKVSPSLSVAIIVHVSSVTRRDHQIKRGNAGSEDRGRLGGRVKVLKVSNEHLTVKGWMTGDISFWTFNYWPWRPNSFFLYFVLLAFLTWCRNFFSLFSRLSTSHLSTTFLPWCRNFESHDRAVRNAEIQQKNTKIEENNVIRYVWSTNSCKKFKN